MVIKNVVTFTISEGLLNEMNEFIVSEQRNRKDANYGKSECMQEALELFLNQTDC